MVLLCGLAVISACSFRPRVAVMLTRGHRVFVVGDRLCVPPIRPIILQFFFVLRPRVACAWRDRSFQLAAHRYFWQIPTFRMLRPSALRHSPEAPRVTATGSAFLCGFHVTSGHPFPPRHRLSDACLGMGGDRLIVLFSRGVWLARLRRCHRPH